jgi:cysteine desulfurase
MLSDSYMEVPKDLIYLDSNATTQVDPRVLEAMLPYLRDFYGNPSSLYRFGAQVTKAISTAREQLAALLHCSPAEILFTSCGTESDNAAIASALLIDRDRQEIVTTSVEHSAVVKQCDFLAKQGIPVRRLSVDGEGQLDLQALEKALTDETAILSVMWANNETGVLFPIEEIGEIAKRKGVLFHTDAVQAIGKIPCNLAELPVQYLSLSGHKLHAPKGIGALYVRNRARFHPYLLGGGQEHGKRAGTENVASIVALGKAAELALASLEEENTVVKNLRDTFEKGVLTRISGTRVNGGNAPRLPNTSSIVFEGVEAEGILMLLDKEGVCASAGSACTTGSLTPSHVLTAMGLSPEQARGSVRFSFSRFNTMEEVERALAILEKAIAKLRGLRQPGDVILAS